MKQGEVSLSHTGIKEPWSCIQSSWLVFPKLLTKISINTCNSGNSKYEILTTSYMYIHVYCNIPTTNVHVYNWKKYYPKNLAKG